MATRSTIALEFADGTVEQVYCHWDGYLSNNGEILFNHYQDPFKVRDLIDQGSISSLGPEIGTKHPFSKFECADGEYDEAAYEGMTTFHHRDRGEDLVKHQFKDFEDYKANHQYEEYEYILRRDGQWYVSQYRENRLYQPLSESLEITKQEEAV